MTPVLVTFLVVFAVVAGLAWVLVLRPEQTEAAQLRRRLKAAPKVERAARVAVVREQEKLSAIAPLHSLLEAAGGGGLKSLIDRSDLKITPGTFVLATACLFFGAWFVVATLSRFWWLGLAVGFLFAFVPYMFLRYKVNAKIAKFEEQFPEAIDLIARSLRAGHAFTTGIAMVAEEAPQPVAGEFRLLYDRQNFGMPVPEALRLFAERIPLLDARFFATAVLTQREAGGNLAEILDNLASVIRERFKVKRQVRVLTAHGRITGWVLSGMPPALALAFMVTSPEHMKVLVEDPMGVKMILGALVLQVIGTLVIRRLVNVSY